MNKHYKLTMLFLALTFSTSMVIAQNQTLYNPNIKATVTKEQIKVYAQNSPKSPANVIDLSFEGCPDYALIGDYYNGGAGGNYGITFSPNSYSLISKDGGGIGNICGNPSPYTCLFFIDGTGSIVNVSGGFTTGFSFYYCSNDAITVYVWDGLNGTGNLLTTQSFPVNYNIECTCSTGIWCGWSPVGVSFSGTAHSVTFSGPEGACAFDDITFGAAIPPLPVELTSFLPSVNGSSVVLKWQTATEVNNYGFEIQRSKAGGQASSFETVGFVNGNGKSNSPKSYSFTDQPTGGTSFSYRLKQMDNDGKFKFYNAVNVLLNVPKNAELMQNSPNPFNPSTTIKFVIPHTSNVTIIIYDLLGREITTLLNEQTDAGYYVVNWNGQDKSGKSVASGIYLYRLTAGSYSQTKKMNLLK